jgi:hypothetical protein
MNNTDSIKTWIQSWWTGSVSIPYIFLVATTSGFIQVECSRCTTRVFIRKFPSIFEKPQNYVRPSAMQISNLALIKLMKVLKNNLAKNDIFVISRYGPFIFIRPSKYGLNMAYRCSPLCDNWKSVAQRENSN